MSRDLSSVLQSFAEDEARAAAAESTDPDAGTQVLVSRVSRRRRMRTGMVTTAAAAVVVVLGVGVYAVTTPEPNPPATPEPLPTHSPTPTEEETPEPEETTEPEETADPGPGSEDDSRPAVTAHPLLPDALPLVPGIFASADDGWYLVDYTTGWLDGAMPDPPSVLYLISPDGLRYEVPVDRTTAFVTDWLEGTSLALAYSGHGVDGAAVFGLVDLEDGREVGRYTSGPDEELTFVGDGSTDVLVVRMIPKPRGPNSWTVERRTLDGTTVASIPPFTPKRSPQWADPFSVSPDRDRILVRDPADYRIVRMRDFAPVSLAPVLEAVRARVPGPGGGPQPCDPVDWFGSDRIIVSCAEFSRPDDDGVSILTSSLWTVRLDGGDARRLLVEGAQPMLDGETRPRDIRGIWSVDGRTVIDVEDAEGMCSLLGMVRADGTVEVVEASRGTHIQDSGLPPTAGRPGTDPLFRQDCVDRSLIAIDLSGGVTELLPAVPAGAWNQVTVIHQ